MDVDNPWQVVSIEAFYCLKCPECMFFTTEDNAFYEHAVKNHPLSGVLFGKPRDETVDSEEILNFLVKNEPPENSSENEDNETFETIIEDSIVKNEPPEDSFENENNETLSEKTSETFGQANVLERESSENESIEQLGKKKKLECKYCFGSFNKRSIKKHQVNCELYQKLTIDEKKCSVCNKTFTRRMALYQHIGTNHKEELKKLPQSAVKSTCNELKKDNEKLKSKEFLAQKDTLIENVNFGLKNNCDPEKTSEKDKEPILKGKKAFQCAMCDTEFEEKRGLNEHVSNVHVHHCQICNKYFPKKHELKIHIAIEHEEIKPFQNGPFLCNFCGSNFGVESKLKLHIQAVHEGTKPFKCHLCDSKFFNMSTITMHMKVHEASNIISTRHDSTVERLQAAQNTMSQADASPVPVLGPPKTSSNMPPVIPGMPMPLRPPMPPGQYPALPKGPPGKAGWFPPLDPGKSNVPPVVQGTPGIPMPMHQRPPMPHGQYPALPKEPPGKAGWFPPLDPGKSNVPPVVPGMPGIPMPMHQRSPMPPGQYPPMPSVSFPGPPGKAGWLPPPPPGPPLPGWVPPPSHSMVPNRPPLPDIRPPGPPLPGWLPPPSHSMVPNRPPLPGIRPPMPPGLPSFS